MVIVLFNTALCMSAFSTVSFRKLVFRLSVLSLDQDIKIYGVYGCSNEFINLYGGDYETFE